MKAETLKKAILQYAMQGKLVEQDPNDEPASVLLERIKAEKEQLIKDGKILKKKPLEPFSAEDIPFEIPKTWEWVYLSDVSIIQEGAGIRSYQYRDSGTQLLTVTNILEDGIDLNKSTKFVDTEEYLTKYKHLTPQKGDIVTACSGGSWGKSAIYDKEDITMLNTSTLRLRFFSDLADNKYLYFITKSGIFKNQLECQLSGMQPNFGYQHYSKILIPLPPLAEQERIVEKLEQILPLVEEYGKNEEKLSKLNSTLPDKIKQSILQHAVQGKLVPQYPSDEPASELLKRIKAEKEQLIKDGKIKKEKPLPPITEDEIPYELPKGWAWVRFSEVFDVRDGTHDSPKSVPNGIPLITSKDFNNGKIDFSNAKLISKEDHDKIQQRSFVEDDDILYSMIGGNIGNMVMVKKDRDFSIKNVALFKYYSKELSNPQYLKLLLSAITIDFKNKAFGGAQQFVSLTFIRNYVIALPPLAEQQRIVSKVEELLAIVESLKV